MFSPSTRFSAENHNKKNAEHIALLGGDDAEKVTLYGHSSMCVLSPISKSMLLFMIVFLLEEWLK